MILSNNTKMTLPFYSYRIEMNQFLNETISPTNHELLCLFLQ